MLDDTTADAPGISRKGRRWNVSTGDEKAARALERAGASAFAARILAGRGHSAGDMADYLDPKLRHLMPDPRSFHDMETGARHVADLVRRGARIGIWSDYDADGATSGAILGWFLRMIGAGEAPLRIPDRMTEGYGPNAPGLLEMQADGCETVCILDAGTVAFEPLEAARDAGLDVVVIDHHAAEAELPPAIAMINPNRQDETGGFGHLCAAGMTFVFCVEVARKLREDGDYFDGRDGRPARVPDLMELLDLVALGTVCDVVPLTGLNRAFVARGLPYLTKRKRPGIAHLAAIAGIAPRDALTAADCGWKLGPRINAGGRIADSTLGARCLLAATETEAEELAGELDRCNTERKSIEASATEQALDQMSDRVAGEDRTLALAVVDGHEGVVGISAGRVKETVDAPAIVLTEAHDGSLKGSARSVPGFDIGHALIAARRAGVLVKGGGHGMAGGLTVTRDRLEDFRAFVNREIEASDYFETGVVSHADIALKVSELTVDMLDGLGQLEPCGTGNPEPIVVLTGAEIRETRVLKDKHLKLVLGEGAVTIEALLWNVVGTPLEDWIAEASRARHAIDVLGKPGINEFRGARKPQIVVDDLRAAAGQLI